MTRSLTVPVDVSDALLAELGPGRGAARRSADLAEALGLSDREVRALVELLRRRGYLIGSSAEAGGGFFLIRTEQELEQTAGHMVSRANSIRRTVAAMRRAAAERFGAQTALRLFPLKDDKDLP